MKKKAVNLYSAHHVDVVFRRLLLFTLLVASLVAYRLKAISLITLAMFFVFYCIFLLLQYSIISIKRGLRKSALRKLVSKSIIHLFIFSLLLFPHNVHAQEFNIPPTRIMIPKIATDLPVFTAKIAYNTWEVRADGASYGEHTSYPGNVGNTVIFSHAQQGLFKDLPHLTAGDEVHLFTDKDWFVYEVTNVQIVEPDNTEVIFSNNEHELTLFTCIGANDSHRFVVKALMKADPSQSF